MHRLDPPDIRPVRRIHNNGQETAGRFSRHSLANFLTDYRINRLGFLLNRQHSTEYGHRSRLLRGCKSRLVPCK